LLLSSGQLVNPITQQEKPTKIKDFMLQLIIVEFKYLKVLAYEFYTKYLSEVCCVLIKNVFGVGNNESLLEVKKVLGQRAENHLAANRITNLDKSEDSLLDEQAEVGVILDHKNSGFINQLIEANFGNIDKVLKHLLTVLSL
jgi:hypothetical protein